MIEEERDRKCRRKLIISRNIFTGHEVQISDREIRAHTISFSSSSISIGSGLAGFVSGAGSISPGLSLLGSSPPSSAYKKKKEKERSK